MREEQRVTIESYNKIAKSWVSKRNSNFWAKEFLKFKKLLSSGSILELGCGSGTDSRYFLESGYSYTGIDLSDGMLQIAQQNHPNCRFLRMDLYQLGFRLNSFAGFWASAVFLHIPKNDIKQVLLGLKKVTSEGAVGFIALKAGTGEQFVQGSNKEDRRFFIYYTLPEFALILSQVGFEIYSMQRSLPDSRGTIWLTYFVRNKRIWQI